MDRLGENEEPTTRQPICYSQSMALLFATLSITILTKFVISRFLHLRKIPGPWWAAYGRLWLAMTVASGESADIYVEVNRKYGPIVRIGPNHLLTDDPELTHRILAARSPYVRGRWYDSLRLDPHQPNLVAERPCDKHNLLRRQMAAGYSGKDIEGMEDIVNKRFSEWTNYIDQHWTSYPGEIKKFDIARSIQYLTTDLIAHLCFGQPMGFVEKHEDVHGFLKTLESRLPIAEQFSVMVEVFTLLSTISRIPWIKRLLIPQNTDTSGVGKILGISRKAIDERLELIELPRSDMLSSFLKNGMDRTQAESEITVSLFAGTDTTATGMRATLLHIISNPTVYFTLRQEISTAAASSLLSHPVQNFEALQLPYLQACIKEGLRIFPPVTALRERLVPADGDTICGLSVPGGVNIGLNTKGLLRNKKVFGKDADVFRPERWFEGDQTRLANMCRVHDLVFGGGITRCLGVRIATLSLNKFFVELLRRYDVSVIDPAKPWISRCHGVFFQRDFFVRVTRREG